MSLEKSLLERIHEVGYKHALLNAVKHKGKASLQAVMSKIMAEIPEARRHARDVVDIVRGIIEEVNKLSLDEQLGIIKRNWPELLEERKRVEEEKKLPPLPNAVMGKVVTRFAPNPDYTIHLGNARPALLSYWYARDYKGRMILRFEDTDPRTKAPFPEAYDRIKEDLRWLGIRWDEEYIQSLRLPIFYGVLRELIKRGGAYVDKCPPEEFRKYRDQGRACPHRDLPIETHLEEFDKILEGYYGEGEAVIRVKTDLKYPDPSTRDWVAARIIDTSKTPHPVVGEKYILWPTYNLAAAVDDHIMGITHILRAKEHVSNTIKQKFLYDHMGWKYPETIHFGRLSLEGVMLSKSRMRRKIIEGYEPYIDIRFGTLSALRRRGIVPETIHQIILDVGTNPIDAYISYKNLAAINRRIIDPIAPRYMFVKDPVLVKITGLLEKHVIRITRNPSKNIHEEYIVEGPVAYVYISSSDLKRFIDKGMIRLMELANIECTDLAIENGKPVVTAKYIDNDVKTARRHKLPIIQWVKHDDYIPIKVLKPYGEEINIEHGYAERKLLDIDDGSIIQFYRYGFVRIEKTQYDIYAIFSHD